MKQLVTIIYKGSKIETVMVEADTLSQCENKAFEYADMRLHLIDTADKSQVELFFHENARAHVLFQDVAVYDTNFVSYRNCK